MGTTENSIHRKKQLDKRLFRKIDQKKKQKQKAGSPKRAPAFY
jgi:hypothetical protein